MSNFELFELDAQQEQSDARGNRDQVAELLALGAMRAVYWLAVANVELALAREIAEWWAECAPLHGQGEIIK
ncbi:hypothetical protein [Aeromonas allosaccharophila]|uniref:hypothetical protein n=1 Tax=Aeromonas allosaccharophila TaxID=656 RepID=UPI003D1ED4B4